MHVIWASWGAAVPACGRQAAPLQGLRLAEFVEEGNLLAEQGVVGAGVADGAVHFAADFGHGLQEKLGEIAEGVGGVTGDAALGHRVEDFGEDMVNVGNSVEVTGEGDELGAELFFLGEALKFFCMIGAEARVTSTAKHATTATVGEGEGTAMAGTWAYSFHGNLRKDWI